MSEAVPFPKKDVLTVAITGAAGQIGYSLIPMIASGAMLGANQKVALRLLDIEPSMKVLQGVQMELEDAAFPLLTDVALCTDANEGFKGVDIAVMCGAFPRKQGMERKDLLKMNAGIFNSQGASLGAHAEKHCRVLVVGNPANTNALLLAIAAKANISPRQVTALTRLDHNRALGQAQIKTNSAPGTVQNAIIWGNHSGTQVPDVNSATANGKKVRELFANDEFWDNEFVALIQQRGAQVINMRGLSSALSAARAITHHVHDWILGTPEGVYVSMGVWTDGEFEAEYGAPKNIIFSLPCTCKDGEWTVVRGIAQSAEVKKRIVATAQELIEEREQAGAV